jgi:hypothetical protein
MAATELRMPTPEEHREWCRTVTQAELDHMAEEYRSWAGESEQDAAVRDLNHVLELQSREAS